jgi:hypothetical protein
MTEAERAPQTPEMDRLVDEVLRGQRVLLFPPGLGASLLVNFLLLASTTVLLVAAIPTFTGELREHRVLAQLGGVLVAATLTMVTATLVLVGAPSALGVMRRTITVLFALALLCLLLAIAGELSGAPTAYTLVVAALGAAHLVVNSRAYFTGVMFRQRLRVRRAAMLRAGVPK